MKKIVLILIFVIGMLSIVNATISISDCNSSLTTSGEYVLTQNITTNTTGTCFGIKADNITFDCQGYTITGNHTGKTFVTQWVKNFDNGVDTVNGENLTIKNCNIKNFDRAIENWALIWYNVNFENLNISNMDTTSIVLENGLRYFFINNVVINNSSAGIWIVESHSGNIQNTQSNNNNGYGISLDSVYSMNLINITTNYNTLDGLSLSDVGYGGLAYMIPLNINHLESRFNQNGINLRACSDNNTIVNSIITNNRDDELFIYYSSSSEVPKNNLFYNNTFGNVSKINSTNWDNTPNFFNTSSSGNYYNTEIIGGKICFDEPNNLSCDYFAEQNPLWSPPAPANVVISTSSGRNPFPIGNLFLGLIGIVGFFIRTK